MLSPRIIHSREGQEETMAGVQKLIAGNWKMNGTRAGAAAFAAQLTAKLANVAIKGEMLICPPALLIGDLVAGFQGSAVAVGGQDCHAKVKGAHTGDIAATQLKDAGCSHVIVGHSERRTDHAETDAQVRAKAEAALAAGLVPIVCIGETAAQRQVGDTLAIVERQLRGSLPDTATAASTVVAYEPVWAIGSGAVPTEAEIAEVHGHLRAVLTSLGTEKAAIRLLYGGSVKGANAGAILSVANVDGVLVGGASLEAGEFFTIAASCP